MLTNYVVQGGEQVYAQPFICQNALFYGMVLPADAKALQQNVCDRLLNDPSGEPGRFVPAGPFVLLAMCHLDKLVSATPPYSTWGAFGEQEIAFWTLVIDKKQDQVYFAFPYIWVDNAYALSMGREIYGFPKQLGRFVIPTDHSNADRFQLDTLALKTLDPNTMGEWLTVMEVVRTAAGPGDSRWDTLGHAVKDGKSLLEAPGSIWDDLKLAEHLVIDVIQGNVPFVFLKQFRDVVDGSKACYQSVIETTCKCTKWNGGGLLGGDYEVTFNAIGNMPIVADLGLGPNPIKPELSFWCEFDFWIGPGTEIWRA